MKLNYNNIMRSKKIKEAADLIAIRIEKDSNYLIKKCRGYNLNKEAKIGETQFQELLFKSKRPLVFSDSYLEDI